MRKIGTPALVLTLLFLCLPLRAAESGSLSIRIGKVTYFTDGSSSENALEKVLDWDNKRLFADSYELNEYLQSQRQILINKKVFRSVLTEYKPMSFEGRFTEVEVIVKLKEAWTIIPIPYYRYDNNLGIVMGLGLSYSNVLGSLTDFHMDSYYSDIRSEVTLDWTDVRMGYFLMDFRFNQMWDTVKTADLNGDVNLEYSYIQSLVRISMNIPIIPWFSYKARPIVRWPYAYDFITNDTDKSNSSFMYQGVIPAYNHLLEWDNVNWIGTLRQGINASVENQVEYDQVAGKLITWVDLIFKGFIYTPFINYNTRVSYFYYYNDFRRNAAERIRGILDYKLSGVHGFFWNQNYPFNVLSLPKIGDFQLSPFFDLGFVLQDGEGGDDIRMNYAAGTSLILFPAILPSFSFSFDVGINIRDPSEFEIRMSSLLFF